MSVYVEFLEVYIKFKEVKVKILSGVGFKFDGFVCIVYFKFGKYVYVTLLRF